MAGANVHPEIIDLVGSSSDDEDEVVALPAPHRERVQVNLNDDDDHDVDARDFVIPDMPGAFLRDGNLLEGPPAQATQPRQAAGGMFVTIDGEEIFIPDEEPRPRKASPGHPRPVNDATGDRCAQDDAFTMTDCLQQVLEIFPDISHEYVQELWNSFDRETDYETLMGRARLDNIVERLVSASSYPKEAKGKLKRKREVSTPDPLDAKQWERKDREAVPNWQKGPIAAICKAEFPHIPKTHISRSLATHKFLFATYLALAKDSDDSAEGKRVFNKGRVGIDATADADTIALNCGQPELVAELSAARLLAVTQRSQREAEKARKRAEQENLQKAIAAGETAECSACFDDLPLNRQIHCDGEPTHFTCFECAETYIKTEVGDARCKVSCPAGCGARFAHSQLNLLENKQLLEKLSQIQQEQDIRDADLEDLESCPFCEYKAILPPIEEDFEFRCQNPECEKVSCRRCKSMSHVPISCTQYAKDNMLSSRHQIEEAMTAALVRSCVKCKKQFIKESGCNKMSCGSCGTLQCYVCSAVIKDYNHFDQGSIRMPGAGGAQGKKCPLYDDVEQRHEREVREAEAKARAEVVQNNPDVSAEDLEIKVSEAVKKADQARMQRADGGYLAGMQRALNIPVLPHIPWGDGFENAGLGGLVDDLANDMAAAGAARPAGRVLGDAAQRRPRRPWRPDDDVVQLRRDVQALQQQGRHNAGHEDAGRANVNGAEGRRMWDYYHPIPPQVGGYAAPNRNNDALRDLFGDLVDEGQDRQQPDAAVQANPLFAYRGLGAVPARAPAPNNDAAAPRAPVARPWLDGAALNAPAVPGAFPAAPAQPGAAHPNDAAQRVDNLRRQVQRLRELRANDIPLLDRARGNVERDRRLLEAQQQMEQQLRRLQGFHRRMNEMGGR